MSRYEETQDQATVVYSTGRQVGFGVAAVMLGCVSFLSLLGVEKALLAIILGGLAMRGAAQGSLSRRLGIISISLGVLFLITLLVILVLFHDKLMMLIRLLEDLS